jgi:hypothetical protein
VERSEAAHRLLRIVHPSPFKYPLIPHPLTLLASRLTILTSSPSHPGLPHDREATGHVSVAGTSLTPHVIEELRSRLDARHQQMIPRPRAGDVEQMTLGVVHFLQIGVVADRFDAFL